MRAVLAAALAALVWSAAAASAEAQTSDAARAGLRYLEWPGKAPPPTAHGLRPALHPVIPARPARSVTPRWAYAARPTPAAAPVAAPAPPQPQPQPQPTLAAAVFAPKSIYDAPPAAAIASEPLPAAAVAEPAVATAPAAPAVQAANDQPRRYSLHRDYGEQPDRTEIPAPVYLDHLPVDLAAPPPPKASAKETRDAHDAGEDPDAPRDPDDVDR